MFSFSVYEESMFVHAKAILVSKVQCTGLCLCRSKILCHPKILQNALAIEEMKENNISIFLKESIWRI